jgi:glycosyltransferase involved in cell wall biosynthesis
MVIVGIFLNTELRTGGNRRYLELMDALAKRGNHVCMIMNAAFPDQRHEYERINFRSNYRRGSFIPVSRKFSRAVKRNIGFIRSSLKTLGFDSVDWVLVHGDAHLGAAVWLKRRVRARLFFAYRCNDVRRAGILRQYGGLSAAQKAVSLAREAVDRLRERTVARESSLVAFQNMADADDYARRIGELSRDATSVIIPGNIGYPRCTDEWKDSNSSVAVSSLLFVGSLDRGKGFGQFVEACSILKSRGLGGLRVSALGKADDERFPRELVERFSVRDMISLEGYADPFPFLASRDLLVYPSLYDAFPDVILEALHAGCPVIASRVGGIPEMLASDELLFDAGDPRSIADAVERCVRDAAHYGHIRKLCASRADEYRFDWAERWERAMKSN